LAFEVFPRSPGPRKPISLRRILSWTSRCSRVYPGRTVRSSVRCRGSARLRGHTLLRFLAPTAHEVTGSDLRRVSRPDCAAPSGFLSLLTLCSPRNPVGSVSHRRRSWGSPFRGFPSRTAGTSLDTPCPSWRCCRRGAVASCPSLVPSRVAAWRPLPLRGVGLASRASAWGFPGAPSGVSARFGSPYSGRRVLRADGSRSSLGFHPSRGFPLTASTRPMPCLPSCALPSACRSRRPLALQGFESSEVGLSLSRLPPLVGSPSSSRGLFYRS
jgi:hypothetical protein